MAIQFGYCLPIFAAPGNPYFRTPNYNWTFAKIR